MGRSSRAVRTNSASVARPSVAKLQRAVVAASAVAASRPPALVATERLAGLVYAGAGPEHLALQTKVLVSTWEADALTPREYATRLETVRNELEAGLEAAETQVIDMNPEERAAVTKAKKGLDAIRASLEVINHALDSAW